MAERRRRGAADAAPEDGAPASLGGNAQGMVRSVVERVERLLEERSTINEDIKEIYAEAKDNGLEPKILRILIRRRAMDAAKRQEQDTVLDLYEHAVGMAPGEPAED